MEVLQRVAGAGDGVIDSRIEAVGTGADQGDLFVYHCVVLFHASGEKATRRFVSVPAIDRPGQYRFDDQW